MTRESSSIRTGSPSLPEVHESVAIPIRGSVTRKMLAFAGPAFLVSVGYMDPGNWATDIEGGSRYNYALLWVLLLSNLMAILLQTLSARLGIVTRRDLAQACRDFYSKPVAIVLWLLCEIAIIACDLAEVLGTAVALNLLFKIPVFYGVLITALDVFLILALQGLGMRIIEAVILALVLTVGGCYVFEIFLARPDKILMLKGMITPVLPGATPDESRHALLVALGILGATVMPHNLYLHSALVQSRRIDRTPAGIRTACRYNFIDSVVALNLAFFVNAAILIMAAAVFFRHGKQVTELQQAYETLSPLLKTSVASTVFAIALLAAGQSSTVTGTLAGQIVMEGFVHLRMRPWMRRLITRSLAIVPAIIVIRWPSLISFGEPTSEDNGTYKLLILSQVVLSMQLPFAIVPLVQFTNSRRRMGEFANPMWVKVLAWTVAAIIISLNLWLLYRTFFGVGEG